MTTTAPAPNQTQAQQQDPMMRDIIWYAMIAGTIYALPAIFLSAIMFQIIRRLRRPWLYWGIVLLIGAISAYYVYMFRHPQLAIVTYTSEIIREVLHIQLSLPHLWATAAPVWLDSLPIAPFIGVLVYVFNNNRSVAGQLREQVRQQHRAKSQRATQAKKRTSTPANVPDVLEKSIVLGVPIVEPED